MNYITYLARYPYVLLLNQVWPSHAVILFATNSAQHMFNYARISYLRDAALSE